MRVHFLAPELPKPRLLAFDESMAVHGYNAHDMRAYAKAACILNAVPWWKRALRRVTQRAAQAAAKEGAQHG